MKIHSLNMYILGIMYLVMTVLLHLMTNYCGVAGDLQYFKVIKNLPALRIFVCFSTGLYTEQFYK